MSLSENLHNLGTLLKTNLETKGINGLTGNEGLTTLANKILDIEGSGSSSKNVVAHVTGNNVTIGKRNSTWLIADDATINWGDGTSNTVNNPQETLSHTYTDGINGHLIALDGTITGLGSDCFYGCTGLTSIFIPNSITSIGARCFIDCSGLTNVVIPNSVTSLGTSCFRECSSLINVIIPNSITNLGNNCFDGCSSLTNVIIPNSITNLGNNCFDGCSSLTNVVIPNSVTSLGTACFKRCSGLTNVIIPDSISSLGDNCFAQCSSLTSVVIPDSVTNLGDQCFFECYGLTSVTIPSSVASLGDWCFHDCNSLIDYQLYWTGNNIITYDNSIMPNNADTIFTIPVGETSNYTAKGYPTSKLIERRPPTLTLTCDKPVIQKTETSTVTAILKQSGSPLTGKTLNYQVKHGNTVISSGTKTTNNSGQATITYTGTGIGDVDFTFTYNANNIILQKTFVVEDCNYWNTAEVTRTSTNGSTIYDNNMSEALPTNCEISFDIWSNNSNTNGEHRFFLLPKSQYSSGTVQPQYGLFVDQIGGNKGGLGQRNNNASLKFIEKYSLTNSSYHTVKIIKTNDSLEFYIDDTLKTTQVLDWINNYTDYCFSMMRWTSSGTSKMKNVKIKAL